MNEIALVTGANKSIGFEVAKGLARAGCTVLVGARNTEAGERAAAELRAQNLDARAIEVDLDRVETAQAAAARIEREFERLDILVNNAAISLGGSKEPEKRDGPPSKASLKALELLFRTNFIGTVAVTQAMLPLLRRSPSARIVNVSSDLGSISGYADPAWKYQFVKVLGYSASKAALNMFTAQLANELRAEGIKVNSTNPGFTATDLNNHAGPQTVEEGAAETIRIALLRNADSPTAGFFETAGPLQW